MMMYTLYNGPAILAVSDDLLEIKKIRDSYPVMMKPFLSIGKKGIGCTIKMGSDDIDKEIDVAEHKPIEKMYLPPIDMQDDDTSSILHCFACGEKVKEKYLYVETHGEEGWDKNLPQPRTETMCWDCASEFKRQIQGREWRIIDFMEGKKK